DPQRDRHGRGGRRRQPPVHSASAACSRPGNPARAPAPGTLIRDKVSDHVNIINHWIGGKTWAGLAERLAPVWNPATGKQQSAVALAGAFEVDVAVTAAKQAFESWSQSSVSRRARILFAFRELINANVRRIAEAISDEHGKVVSDAEGEV